jgi:hypothetical protein
MKTPLFPGLVLTALGLAMLLAHALFWQGSPGIETAPVTSPGASLATIPAPLAAGWTVLSGGLAWLVARPRGDRV